ncbi:methyl-accepting chemotaxis protein [Cryptosporangium japonicum]|uniref:Methyl-accepting transducer domain-containing protein n=1 Tax=Cryptosporangium japonicum TaxID=80872 RepID=A0ABN0TLE0_9ACTN
MHTEQATGDALRQSADAIRAVVEASAEIEAFVKLLNSVTEQTKLLALNASVEAARAGAAGRGFAIVASEVKDLAIRTADGSDAIRRSIDALRQRGLEAERALARLGGQSEDYSEKPGTSHRVQPALR